LSSKKFKFIINKNAASGEIAKNLKSIIDKIKKGFPSADCNVTKSISELNDCLCNLDGVDAVIAVGGDGTLNGILNKIGDENIIFGMLPYGTGNDFAYSAKVPTDMDEALDLIKKYRIKNIDLGKITTDKYSKYFINTIGIGFDAMVAYKTNHMKFLKGKIKYFLSLIIAICTYKSYNLNIKTESTQINKKCFLLSVGNGKRSGGAFLLTPNAVIDDSVFQLCIADDISLLKFFISVPKVLNGSHGKLKIINFQNAKQIKIETDSEMYLHYDGETPYKINNALIEVLPAKIKFIC
jgi:YegS/Rv2252/BmrU family lipid kinase